WISSPIVERGISAARTVGRIAALKNGWDDSSLDNYPLFPLLNFVRKDSCSYIYNTAPLAGVVMADRQRQLQSRLADTKITEADIVELERFDGFRDWRSDPDIQVGKYWPLTSHQCRRSLAVYSARSGMVSLGSLASQFKHLTE